MRPEKHIDIHTHIWSQADGLTEVESNRRDLIEAADRFDIEAYVVMPLFGGWHPSRREVRVGNDAVADFARQEPRVRPFCRVHPEHEDQAVDEIRRCVGDMGFPGAKIWVTVADHPCVYRVIEQMIEHDRPTLIHCLHKSVGQLPTESEPQHIAALARRYPEAKIIMAHFGGNFLYSCDAVADCSNVWTDPSGSYCETGMLEHAAKVLGVERLVYGSDAPGAAPINNIAKVMAADLSDEAKHRIMYANAKELLP